MTEDNEFNLPSAIERFRQAGELLSVLGQRLSDLELAEASQTKAAQSIEGASSTLASSASELAILASGMRETCALIEQVMESARQFLESTDLSSLYVSIDELKSTTSSDQRSVVGQIQMLHESVASAISSLDKSLADQADATNETLTQNFRANADYLSISFAAVTESVAHNAASTDLVLSAVQALTTKLDAELSEARSEAALANATSQDLRDQLTAALHEAERAASVRHGLNTELTALRNEAALNRSALHDLTLKVNGIPEKLRRKLEF